MDTIYISVHDGQAIKTDETIHNFDGANLRIIIQYIGEHIWIFMHRNNRYRIIEELEHVPENIDKCIEYVITKINNNEYNPHIGDHLFN
jgi:predicted ThiF/HesA family dinucleotide-utilizing enzyme